ncbi:MAG: hypothetical protein R2697_08625 [Ilumatobacteraceae bacterium]
MSEAPGTATSSNRRSRSGADRSALDPVDRATATATAELLDRVVFTITG